MDQPTAEDALRALDPLVGEWLLEAQPPGGEPWPGGGRAIFEWHDSGAHLVERSSVEMPEALGLVDVELAFGHHENRTTGHGYAETREAVKSWRRTR